MTLYKVSAVMHGKRILTDISWSDRISAEKYASETNRNFPGSRAMVEEVP
jgi:hypothetical protein